MARVSSAAEPLFGTEDLPSASDDALGRAASVGTADLLAEALDEGEPARPRRAAPHRSYSFIGGDDTTERRRTRRFDFSLPATLRLPRSSPRPCTASAGSVDGLFLRTDADLSPGTQLQFRIELLGSRSSELLGEVIRQAGGGVGVQFHDDPQTRTFRGDFIQLAREATLQPPRVEVELAPERRAPEPPTPTADLDGLWRDVLEAPDDDEAHQRFIHAAMKQGKLEVAIGRYKARKAAGDDRAVGYLDQIGVIMGFYAQPGSSEDDGHGRAARLRPYRGALVGLLAVVLAVVGARVMVGSMGPASPPVTEATLDVEPVIEQRPGHLRERIDRRNGLLEPIPLEAQQ